MKRDEKNEIVTTRIVKFPQELVFAAWSKPEHLKVWWGPNGFTNTFEEFDFRVGGKWNFTMHGPERGNYHNECEFTEIRIPALIAWKRITKPLFKVVVEFEEVANSEVRVTFRQIFETLEECDKIRPFVTEKNEENIDRLEVELLKMRQLAECRKA